MPRARSRSAPPRVVASARSASGPGPRLLARSRAPVLIRAHEAEGSSRLSFEAAVRDAIARGRKEHPDVVSVEVVKLSGALARGRIRTYRATVRLGYRQRLSGP